MERSSNIGSGVGGVPMMIDATDRDMIERGDRIGAALVRELLAHYDDAEARIAAAEEAENEAKDCFWAVYPEWVRMKGHGISTEAARTMLGESVLIANRNRDAARANFLTMQGTAAVLVARIKKLEAALAQSMTALDDWLNDYAEDECNPVRVAESRARIYGQGTLAYIAGVQAINRAALALPVVAPTTAGQP